MARLVMVYLGKLNGVDAYGPMDAVDEKAIKGKKMFACDVKGEKCLRTTLQNNAIHKYFELLAEALNDAGWDMKAAMEKLSRRATIPWSPLAVKERLWRPVQENTFKKLSTTKLETNEVSTVYEALNQVTSEQLGVSVQFPERHWQLYEQNYPQENMRAEMKMVGNS